MTMYQVLVERDPRRAEECAFGEFESLVSAVAAARGLVDDYPCPAHRPGMSAEALYLSCDSLGPLPSIVRGSDYWDFHARAYAWCQCQVLCRAGAAPARPEVRSDPANLATLLGSVALSPQQDERIARLL